MLKLPFLGILPVITADKGKSFDSTSSCRRGFVVGVVLFGEATRHAESNCVPENPDIPWIEMRDMRTVVVHEYLTKGQNSCRRPR